MSTQTLGVADIPSIAIFVRHSADCKYRGDETARTCRCPKHFRYSVDGKQVRQSARTRLWKTAEDRRRQLEASFAADPSGDVAIAPESRKTIAGAIEVFLTHKQNEGIGENVLAKYKRELERLKTFMEREGRILPSDIRNEDIIKYQATWKKLYPSSHTRSRVLTRVRAFLRFCYDSRWIDRIPKGSPVTVDEIPTLPLTAEEYQKLLDTIPSSFPDVVTIPGSEKVVAHTRASVIKDRAARMRALVRLMRHSGLAIRDAVTLSRNELLHDKSRDLWRVVTARQKTGTDVSVLLPPDVARELLAAFAANSNKQYAFWTGSGHERTPVSHWQEDFRKLFKDAGLYDNGSGNMVSHRLRDTFAVDLLEKGVPLEEVSKLLGHESVKTTEKHYAKWVKARQDRLDALVTATW